MVVGGAVWRRHSGQHDDGDDFTRPTAKGRYVAVAVLQTVHKVVLIIRGNIYNKATTELDSRKRRT